MGFWSFWKRKKPAPSPYPITGRDPEFQALVARLYLEELGREVDANGLIGWMNALRYGMTADQLRQKLHDSEEGVAYRARPPVEPPPPTPVVTRRVGITRTNGHRFVDDTGEFFPLGATMMWAVNGWRNERDRLKKNAEWFRDHGVDYIRIACQAGWVNPDWPDYETLLGELIDWTYDECGMRVEPFIIGGGARDALNVAEKVARVINAGRTHKVIYGLAANEGYNGNCDEPTMIAVTRYMRAHTPNLWAVSDPVPGDRTSLDNMLVLSQHADANLYAFEPDRSPRDLDWGMVRQTYDVKEFRGPVAVVEPPGPDSSVRELRDPLQLACMRANSIICGAGAFVFHCGSMVLGQKDPNHPGRVPNIWEVNNIDAMMNAVRDADTHLPAGVENWTVANTGWRPPLPVAPFQPDALWSGGADHGVNKAYSARSNDNRYVQLLLGVKDFVVMTAEHECITSCFDMSNNAHIEDKILKAGDAWRLPGRSDTMTAYLLVGKTM